jgi:hypothetical protein
MSRPNIAGPTSARLRVDVFGCRDEADFFSAIAVVLLIRFFVVQLTARIKAKTRSRFQPRVFVKIQFNKRQRRRQLRRRPE